MCALWVMSLLIAVPGTTKNYVTSPQATQPAGPGVIPGWLYETGYVSHDPTGVGSGTDGSVMLFRERDHNCAEFLFVEGDSLWVRCAIVPDHRKATTTRGMLIRSKTRCNIDDPVEFSRMLLSQELVRQYANRKPRHFPFLTGYGWNTGPTGTRGALLEEAQLIADGLGLNLSIVGNAKVGRVRRQISPAGDLVGQDLTLEVELDDVVEKGALQCFSLITAAQITDDDRDGYVEVLSLITPGSEELPRFWKLPNLPPGIRMRVGTPIVGSDISISVTAGESELGAYVRGRQPLADFDLPSGPVFITGKVTEKAEKAIHLYVSWDAEFAARAASVGKERRGD